MYASSRPSRVVCDASRPSGLNAARELGALGSRQRAHAVDQIALHPPRVPRRVGDLHPPAEIAILLSELLASGIRPCDNPASGIACRYPPIVVDVDGDLSAELVEFKPDGVAVGETGTDDSLLVVDEQVGGHAVSGDQPEWQVRRRRIRRR